MQGKGELSVSWQICGKLAGVPDVAGSCRGPGDRVGFELHCYHGLYWKRADGRLPRAADIYSACCGSNVDSAYIEDMCWPTRRVSENGAVGLQADLAIVLHLQKQ